MNPLWSVDDSSSGGMFPTDLFYVHIENWEYQCCGELPRRGGTVRGALTLHPSHRPGYPAPVVHGWDPRTGEVGVESVTALLGHSITDPYRTDLIVSLGWHAHGRAPRIEGVVDLLVEETGRYIRDGAGGFTIAPASASYREVDEATRWPEERPALDGPATAGVVAGIRITRALPSSDDEALGSGGHRLGR